MATVTKGRTFVSGETVTPTKLNELVDLATVTSIQAADIASDAVTTAKILDANVTTAKLADSAVTTAKVNDSAVTTAKINNAAVTAAKLDGAQTGSAPIYGCRAWVNFDGTKDTTGAASTANTNRLIRGSGNVASVLRNTLGTYTITFTTAMPDANYAPLVTTGTTGTSSNAIIGYELDIASRSTSSVRIACGNNEVDQFTESPQVTVAIFR